MKAIEVDGDRLVWADTPSPILCDGEIRIRVKASAVNRADLSQRKGGYPPPPGASPILGLECSGVVEEIADHVTGFKIGDAVCALLAGGGHAQEVVVPAGQVLPIPKGLSFIEAAALPEVFATAYLNLYDEAALKPGERVLLHAGASGVGTAGIQLCRVFGNPVFVTAGSDDKIERCLSLGAAAGANRHGGSFVDHVAAWTGGHGFDVILDPVGAAYLQDNIGSLAIDGRLVLIGLLGGVSAELPLGLMLRRRLRVIGSTLRARSVAAKSVIMSSLHDRVWPLIESGQIRPIVEAVFPIAETGRAHELLASDQTFGKLVLAVD